MPSIMADENRIRTIDNLPIDAHTRYDVTREKLKDGDKDLIRESKIVQGHVGLDSLSSTLNSQVDLLFGIGDGPESETDPPLGFNTQKARIFDHDQAVPGLGSDDQIDAIRVRVDGIKDSAISRLMGHLPEIQTPPSLSESTSSMSLSTTDSPVILSQGEIPSSSPQAPLEEKNSIENEANTLQSMLSEIASINKSMKEINGARAGFQKG